MYGSSRLGIWRIDTVPTAAALWQISNYANRRQYELSNHLGNVMAVIGDYVTVENDTIQYPSVFSLNDYYVFGATKRWSGSEGYRYGFNGKENDDEVKGKGNSVDFGARIHDPRLGRFLSLDPLSSKYPGESNYVFVSNSPIIYIDPDGQDRIEYVRTIAKDGTVIIRVQRTEGVYKSMYRHTYGGLGYFTKHDYSVYTTNDYRSGELITTSREVISFEDQSEVNFIDYLKIKAMDKIGSINVRLPQVVIFGSGLSDPGWGDKADSDRPIMTFDFSKYQEIIDLALLGKDVYNMRADLKEVSVDRMSEILESTFDRINANTSSLSSIKEEKKKLGKSYCVECELTYEPDKYGYWKKSHTDSEQKDTIEGHNYKVKETKFKSKKNE
ncbi:RHS repeat-associated core domain-containing protein [Gynurincola endophyticus]|uniref:RHS repeat-associated core domain-containing protein n=1 Tax=Gynurincola endophyticus TaxID=2479004 RepID=UPI000F8E6923|nr:RHS repeat-associated core domain-containing protein [Gynurincola endophyticus]